MEILEWIRFLAGVGLLLIGMGIFALQLFGVFKFKYVLNRMHAAAMGDTLGLGASLVGLILLSGFNITSVKNVINELHPDLDGEMIDGSWIYREGESSYQMYIREYTGVDPENGDALWYVDVPQVGEDGTPLKDANGEPVVKKETTNEYTNATRYATGDILPKAYGGFGTNLSAYGFDFGISFAYQFGGRIYDNTYAALMHQGTSDDAGQN